MKKPDFDFIQGFCKDCKWYKQCDQNYICPPLDMVKTIMWEDEE